jgi:hypothetical protein
MKIYVSHSTQFNYQEELYRPLTSSKLYTSNEIILPHKDSLELFSSKDYFASCDLVIAEVSFPSTGVGIELGWANAQNIKIICVYKTGSKFSSSLKAVSKYFIEYSSPEDLIKKLEEIVSP